MRPLTTAIAAALMIGVCAMPARAHIPPESTELNWELGALHYDGGSSELLVGVRVGRNLEGGLGVEGAFDLTPADTFKGYFLNGNVVYNFDVAASERFVPFVSGGAGMVSIAPDVGDSNSNFSVNFGGGIKAFTTPRLAIRGDIRDHVVFDTDTTNNLQFSAGLTWFFRSDL